MARVRYYTYKVTSIDLAEYHRLGKDGRINLFIDYVPMKRNAASARLEVSSTANGTLVFLSTVRVPRHKNYDISSVKTTRLTKRQILIVKKTIAQAAQQQKTESLPYIATATANSNTYTVAVSPSFVTATSTVSGSSSPSSFITPASTVSGSSAGGWAFDTTSVLSHAHDDEPEPLSTPSQELHVAFQGLLPPRTTKQLSRWVTSRWVTSRWVTSRWVTSRWVTSRWVTVGIPVMIVLGLFAVLWAAYVWGLL